MIIIPSIDLRGGKCVRLKQGRENASTEYSDDPVETAREFWRQGARALHVVNLDGAFGRDSQNLNLLAGIASEVPLNIQYGGGLRSLDSMADAFDAGAAKIVLGTVAIENPPLLDDVLRRFGTEKVIVALDALNGRVVTRGWKTPGNFSPGELARSMRERGVREILYTDVTRDGMLSGPDLATIAGLAASGLLVIASGGISSAADVAAIRSLNEPGISGVVVGTALYEGRVTLRELMEITDSRMPSGT